MLNGESRLCPNEAHVAAKVMDGEAVLINLATGVYYSMGDVGGAIWALIEQRSSLDAIASVVATGCQVDVKRVRDDLAVLAEELLKEDLVSLCEEGPELLSEDQPELSPPYEAPTLQKFTDMIEVFALDPPLPGLSYQSGNTPQRNTG